MEDARMTGGKWWLVTCTTFGIWLPGDPRGLRTWRGREYVPPPKRSAKPGEAMYQAENYATEYNAAQDSLTEEPMCLNEHQREVATAAIIDAIDDTAVLPVILAVGDVHFYLLAKFGSLRIRTTMGRFKAAATKELHLGDVDSDRVWTRGCHMKSKLTREEFIGAFRYVQRHESEGCVVHVWTENIPDDCRFLIPRKPLDDLTF